MKTHREKDGLVNKVRVVYTEKAKFIKEGGSFIEGPKVPLQRTVYDHEGNHLEASLYKANGALLSHSVYTYDVAGNCVRSVRDYGDNGELLSQAMHTESVKENRVEETILTPNGSIQTPKAVYSYNDKDNLTELSLQESDGHPLAKLVSSYDTNSHLREAVFRDANDSLAGKSIVTDEATERSIEVANYDPNGYLATKIIFTYDEQGNQTAVSQYAADGNLFNKETYTYKFDQYGNWIRKERSKLIIKTNEYEPVDVTYRTITYY